MWFRHTRLKCNFCAINLRRVTRAKMRFNKQMTGKNSRYWDRKHPNAFAIPIRCNSTFESVYAQIRGCAPLHGELLMRLDGSNYLSAMK